MRVILDRQRSSSRFFYGGCMTSLLHFFPRSPEEEEEEPSIQSLDIEKHRTHSLTQAMKKRGRSADGREKNKNDRAANTSRERKPRSSIRRRNARFRFAGTASTSETSIPPANEKPVTVPSEGSMSESVVSAPPCSCSLICALLGSRATPILAERLQSADQRRLVATTLERDRLALVTSREELNAWVAADTILARQSTFCCWLLGDASHLVSISFLWLWYSIIANHR